MLFLMGCANLRPARVPMRTLALAPARGGSRTLIVLLPGRRDRPEDFVRYGFAEAAAGAGVKAEMIAVDAPLSYYYKKTILVRLREDVIAPARARGVERIWIAGISVGGTGAMLYAAEHPEDLAGIVTLRSIRERTHCRGRSRRRAG